MLPVIPSGWSDAIAVHPRYAARGGQKEPWPAWPEDLRSERRQEMDREGGDKRERNYSVLATVALTKQPCNVRNEAQSSRG